MAADPIPFDQARRGRTPRRSPPLGEPEDNRITEQCPILALGHAEGRFYFLDITGQVRTLTARQLGARSELLALFLGQVEWLEVQFPQRKMLKDVVAGETVLTEISVDFNASKTAAFLMREASAAGIYGPHIVLRKPGIWVDTEGYPAVHCGGRVHVGGKWLRAGNRYDGTIWVAGPAQPEPGTPAPAEIGQRLESDLARLWKFKHDGGPIIAVGVTATSMLGAAAPWRPNAFATGGVGSGKSMLIDALRAACPLHHYSNDTSSAGVTGAVNGHAMPIFIDEASDRTEADGSGAQKLMDLVLAASRGEGVKGHRGTADGGVRTIEMAGCFIYGAVAPPELQPQHLARITVIDLLKPEGGADNKAAMDALIARNKEDGPALWGRMLACFDAWRESVTLFRAALAQAGCAPREQDQMSAILAGWWCLTADGLPAANDTRAAVAQIAPFVRVAADVAEDDGPRRVLQHLLAQQLQYDGSTRKEQVGTLLERGFRRLGGTEPDPERMTARETLSRHGIRIVTDDDDSAGQPAPRLSKGDGIWIMPPVVRGLFAGSRFEGERWKTEMLRLDGARGPSKSTVRVGNVPGKPIWLARTELEQPESVGVTALCKALDIKPTKLRVLMDKHGRDFPIAFASTRPDPKDLASGVLFDLSAVRRFLQQRGDIPPDPPDRK